MDGGFDDAVSAVGEEGVCFLDAAEREAVGYQVGGVDFAFGDELHDFVAVAGIDASCLEREVLAIHPRQGQYLFLLVESHNRDDGIRTGASPCEFKGVLAAGDLNDAVGTATISNRFEKIKAFCRLYYLDIWIMLAHEMPAALVRLANDYLMWLIQLHTFQSA